MLPHRLQFKLISSPLAKQKFTRSEFSPRRRGLFRNCAEKSKNPVTRILRARPAVSKLLYPHHVCTKCIHITIFTTKLLRLAYFKTSAKKRKFIYEDKCRINYSKLCTVYKMTSIKVWLGLEDLVRFLWRTPRIRKRFFIFNSSAGRLPRTAAAPLARFFRFHFWFLLSRHEIERLTKSLYINVCPFSIIFNVSITAAF